MDSKEPTKRQYKKRPKEPLHFFSVQPRHVQFVKKPKTFVNHSYSDFSCVPPDKDFLVPKCISEMTFSQKLHCILSETRNDDTICWMPHGRSFVILRPTVLEQHILPQYYNHSRYSKFCTELRAWGFKYLTKTGCYYHECFLKGRPHLLRYMPMYKIDTRKKRPDPDNEPDFDAIDKKFPVSSPKLITTPVNSSTEASNRRNLSNQQTGLLSKLSVASTSVRTTRSSLQKPPGAKKGLTSELPDGGRATPMFGQIQVPSNFPGKLPPFSCVRDNRNSEHLVPSPSALNVNILNASAQTLLADSISSPPISSCNLLHKTSSSPTSNRGLTPIHTASNLVDAITHPVSRNTPSPRSDKE